MWKITHDELKGSLEMDIFDHFVSELVFARKSKMNFDRISMDTPMLRVLLELDGSQSMGELCKKLGLELAVLKVIVNKLFALGMVERAERADPDKEHDRKRIGNWRGAQVDLH